MSQIWGHETEDRADLATWGESEPDHRDWIATIAADEVARIQAETLAADEARAALETAFGARSVHEAPTRSRPEHHAAEGRTPDVAEKARASAAHDDMVKIKRATWLLSGLTATLVLVSVVLVATSIQMWRARSEVQAIEQRLATLEAFETRIVGRLDSFNAGIQNLIGKTNDVFYKTRAQVEETATVSRTAAGEIATSLTELQDMVTNMQSQPIAPVEQPVRRRAPGAGQAVAQPAVMPPASKAFERIVNSDGSTTYRHMR